METDFGSYAKLTKAFSDKTRIKIKNDSLLVATLVGVPMYVDIFGIFPIAEALIL